MRVGKGIGMGFLQLPCLTWSLGYSSSVSSIICDKNSSIERHRHCAGGCKRRL